MWMTTAPFSSSYAVHSDGKRMCGNGAMTFRIHSRTVSRPCISP